MTNKSKFTQIEATVDLRSRTPRVRDLNTGRFLPSELMKFADDHGLIHVVVEPKKGRLSVE